MPPFVGRKRQASPSSELEPSASKKLASTSSKQTKAEIKQSQKPNRASSRVKAVPRAVKKASDQVEESESSSESSADSEDFEDILPAQNTHTKRNESDDDDVDWEDALDPGQTAVSTSAPPPSGDLELTLSKKQDFAARALTDDSKKGPTKIERHIRITTHCMHVQMLLFHYLVRNGWASDQKAQKILVDRLPANLSDRVQKWRLASGLVNAHKDAGIAGGKKEKPGKRKARDDSRQQRDWSDHAARQASETFESNQADPLSRLLKELVAYWKREFRVVAPSVRKQGYKAMNVLQEEIRAFNTGPHDPEQHGERVQGRSEFRRCAKFLEGSRDISAQLFACLLRGLGIEARLVASLQPVGFGWSKSEDAPEKREKRVAESDDEIDFDMDDESSDAESEALKKTTANLRSALESSRSDKIRSKALATKAKPTIKSSPVKGRPTRKQPVRGSKDTPINIDGDEHISIDSNSSALSDAESMSSLETNEPTNTRRKPNASFDRDMVFPNVWVEAISPLTSRVIPVDPTVLFTVATDEEILASFEPRGKKADKAKQILAYVVAFNSDGTAKDVTTRYLKRRQWPGKTKGVRIPVEKVALYNRRGKVQRYEHYDWFKRVMSGYTRPAARRTQADDLEEQTDLVPLKINKSATDKPVAEIETLAGYKQSTEFVLERHLRRDEALVPNAKPFRHFTPTTGKSTKASKASAKPEPVYRRVDVVPVKTAESWHKEGREIVAGAQPLKTAPIRAVTLARKREIEEATRTHGAAPTQGLYSKDQTDWIVPDPIRDGKIPRNAYGTIDVFVPRMVPQGAAHVPYRGATKACKKLGCDFAEAVVGFEFGNRRAVPVTRGVVVAEEWANALVDEIRRDEEAKRIKEEGKRTAVAITTWRKFLMGLRIIERVRAEYGPEEDGTDERNPFIRRGDENEDAASKEAGRMTKPRVKRAKKPCGSTEVEAEMEDAGGGFVVEEGEDDDMDEGGGFLVEDPDNDAEEDSHGDDDEEDEQASEDESGDDDDEAEEETDDYED